MEFITNEWGKKYNIHLNHYFMFQKVHYRAIITWSNREQVIKIIKNQIAHTCLIFNLSTTSILKSIHMVSIFLGRGLSMKKFGIVISLFKPYSFRPLLIIDFFICKNPIQVLF